MLLDGETLDLVQHIDTVLAAVAGHELEPRINAELMQSVIEITTPVCRTAADVDGALRQLRTLRRPGSRTSAACASARRARTRSACSSASGSPPRDRYRQLVDQMQYVARRELIFGMHVHVAVDSPEKAIRVVNGLIPQLAPLLALSASSPFWRGEPTGLHSSRQMVFAAFPRSGPPPRFKGLRRLRRRDPPARAHGLHRRLHADLVGHPPAPAARHRRGAHLRRGHARRARGRDRRVLPGVRQAPLRGDRPRRGDRDATTASSRPRTSGSRAATGSRRRSWTSRPASGTASRSRS